MLEFAKKSKHSMSNTEIPVKQTFKLKLDSLGDIPAFFIKLDFLRCTRTLRVYKGKYNEI